MSVSSSVVESRSVGTNEKAAPENSGNPVSRSEKPL
jgi:hypothetical protein